MKLFAILTFIFGMTSCEAPFTVNAPWGQVTQDENGNLQFFFNQKPKATVVESVK